MSRSFQFHYVITGTKKLQILHCSCCYVATGKKSSELNTPATFASEEEQIIVRFLEDTSESLYKLHLILNNSPAEDELSIIGFDDHDISLLVDESRHLEFEPTLYV